MTSESSLPVDSLGIVTLSGKDFLAAVTGLRQFTVFGDTHNAKNSTLLADEHLIKAQALRGNKHYFLEMTETSQPLVDAYIYGNATATEKNGETFPIDDAYMLRSARYWYQLRGGETEELAQALADNLKHSKDNSIQTDFYDIQPAAYDKYPDMRPIYAKTLEIGHSGSDAYLESLPIETKERYQLFVNEFEKERAEITKQLSTNIKTKAGNDKAMIQIGSGHILFAQDLDEFLGSDKTTTVVFLESSQDPLLKEYYERKRDLPDYFYFLDKNMAMVPPAQGKEWLCEMPYVQSALITRDESLSEDQRDVFVANLKLACPDPKLNAR